MVVSLALTRSEFPISRVYGVDLVGAGVGCVLVLLLLEASDAPTAIMWVGVLAMLASVTFSGTEAPGSGRKATLLGVMTLVSVRNGLGPYGLQPLAVKGSFEGGSSHIFREWNSFSRVAVFPEIEALPAMWGPSWRMPENTKPMLQRRLQIDGDAGTMAYRFSGDLNEFQFLRSDVTNIAYFLPGREKTAVIGVGGGRDVLSAAVFGATDITAVEVNPIFVRLLTVEEGFADFTNIDRVSGLKLVVDEGRSWFARTDESFDLIQMSLVDTWAATGAGAFTLSENGLYTVEAWQTFVSRLAPDGVFTVSRWFNPETVNETGRLISLGAATLITLGVESPADHLLLISQGNVTTLVLSRSPFNREGLEVLHQAASFLEHRVLLSPLQESVSRDLQKIVSAESLDALELVTADYTYDLSPPTDDRPFFFNQLRFDRPVEAMRISASLMGLDTIGGGIREGNVIATVTLIVLFMVSLLLVLATVVLPLRGAIANAGKPLVVAGTVYFLLIGMGFMLIEIGLLQRTSVFLGHPIYSLGVLLSSLIIATGLGSLLSGRFSLVSRKAFLSWSLLTSGYLLLVAFLLPDLLEANRTASLPLKTLISVAIIAPAGILMGFAFPTGMALVSAVDERPTPWFWGINGAAGVLASVMAIGISMAAGISMTLMVGAFCYLLLLPCYQQLRKLG